MTFSSSYLRLFSGPVSLSSKKVIAEPRLRSSTVYINVGCGVLLYYTRLVWKESVSSSLWSLITPIRSLDNWFLIELYRLFRLLPAIIRFGLYVGDLIGDLIIIGELISVRILELLILCVMYKGCLRPPASLSSGVSRESWSGKLYRVTCGLVETMPIRAKPFPMVLELTLIIGLGLGLIFDN